MKVYCIMEDQPYHQDCLVEIYLNKEAAELRAKEVPEGWYVREVEVKE